MIDDFAELVKKNMLHRFLFLEIIRASFKTDNTIFNGYTIKIRDKESWLFISDIEDYCFHSAYSVFGDTCFRDRCLWVSEALLIHPHRGMLV